MATVKDKLKILVIDDSRVFLRYVELIFNEEKYVVKLLNDPKGFKDEINKFLPDLILTDFEMPDVSGPEICSAVKSDNKLKFIPIMMLTSKEEEEDLIHAIKMGADDFVVKSSSKEVIYLKANNLLRMKKLSEEVINFKQTETMKGVAARYNHEFNNILTVVRGHSQILLKKSDGLNEESIDRIQKIKKGSDQLLALIKKISEIENYEEVDYSEKNKMLKIS